MLDNYDFNYNIEKNSRLIRNLVLSGEYATSKPIIYKLEKKFGINRHIVVPSPSDALLLQTLSDYIRPKVLSKQPSRNSYFSRDDSRVTRDWSPSYYGGNWLAQWKKMQGQIYKFSKISNFLVVTDISDFYDNIDLSVLRRNLSNITDGKDAVVLNLMLKIVESLSWKPNYLPGSNRGLPTVQMEAVRLLAHLTLFEVDRFLLSNADDNFARWMDDITFGVPTIEIGKVYLSTISDILKVNGLSLNIAKTNILSAHEARKEFMFDENLKVSILESKISNGIIKAKLEQEVTNLLHSVTSNKNMKHWDKVTKRVIGLFPKLKSNKFLPDLEYYYLNYPTLRTPIIAYLRKLGYNKKTSEIVLKITKGMELIDDVSLFQIVNLITDWQIKTGDKSSSFLIEIDEFLNKKFRLRESPFDFYCYLWLKAKYSKPKDLIEFIERTSYIWSMHPFLRRQIIAVIPRVYPSAKKKNRELLNQQLNSGDVSSISIALQLIEFLKLKKLDNKLKFYLFPKNLPDVYPLPKFLVLSAILNSTVLNPNQRDYLKKQISQKISDPYYLMWLRRHFR